MNFSYLADKIAAAAFRTEPFKHVYIDDFLAPEHFEAITTAPEVALKPARSDEHLFEQLFATGYRIIEFPGCITDQAMYVKWHKHKGEQRLTNTACEGFGMTLRLAAPKSEVLTALTEYMNAAEFQRALAAKFGLRLQELTYDAGLQKYLDGYEISPHPDIRRKAATYMVNINPGRKSVQMDHHTHYMRFKDQYKYVQAFWEGNPARDRCWVPWNWCDTASIQTQNNSVVLFQPSNDTLHAVKAKYEHLSYQRTQLYGNLWYNELATDDCPPWESFQIAAAPAAPPKASLKSFAGTVLPPTVKKYVKGLVQTNSSDLLGRNTRRK